MRSHFGCLTCRRRKVKCDEARPVCGPCGKSSRDCQFSSNCIFRHCGVEDIQDAGDLSILAEDHIWVDVPSRLTFIQVIDPFAEEETAYFLDGHPPTTTPSPLVPTTGQDVVPTPGSDVPEDNALLLAVLLQHFKESPSQWMDWVDSNAYFSTKVPIIAATRPMLKASACSLAAKHLYRLCQAKSTPISQLPHLRNSPLRWTIGEIDWKYEAVRLYDQAINQLKEAVVSPREDDRQEMFAVISILCMYELIDAPSTEWRAHLSALTFLHRGLQGGPSPGSPLPNSLLQISRSVFWSLVHQDCLSAFVNETQTRLDLHDIDLWRHFGLAIDEYGILLPSASLENHDVDRTWLDEDMLSNALIWINSKIYNFITSGDGINPGDFESPRGDRPRLGTTQEDLLDRWKNLELELHAWHDSLPSSFTPCARKQLPLSKLVPGPNAPSTTIDAVLFTVPMCAVTIQTYHMSCILLLINMPQESTAIRSTVTARLKSYRQISIEVLHHAREICGIAVAGIPDALRPHTVQPLFVAGQCFEHRAERQLVIDLLRCVEKDVGWATDHRVQDLMRQWAGHPVG